MRTRIALAILGTAVGALVLAGLGTLVVQRVTARTEAEERVRDQTESLAAALVPTEGEFRPRFATRALRRLADGLRVDELAIVTVTPNGRIIGEPPVAAPDDGVTGAAGSGITASGHADGSVWAATPVSAGASSGPGPRRGGGNPASRAPVGTAVVVASAPDEPPPAPVLGVFAWVALGTVAVGGLVALILARGLTVPLRRAEDATARIAAGDLSTRIEPLPPGTPREVTDLSTAINTMASELERSQGLDRQFLMSVSHDLRTPLTSIRGWAEAIGDGTARDPAAAAHVIEAEARRLDRLVGDLLDLGRIDSRRFSLAPVDVEMAPLVAGVAAGSRPDAEAAGLHIDVVDRSGRAQAFVDPDRLGQVVANLIENALKFASSRVIVSVDADQSAVSITVGDDGPGIAPEDLPHLFERLYVSRHLPPRRESGSGLGLAIVRELTTAMGGTVDVRSPNDSGTGTNLRVTFPRSPSTHEGPSATPAPANV